MYPETFREYHDGMFSINRTTKPFSGNQDLTLEKTVNTDAASLRAGIAPMTNSISARLRWAESHFLRTSISYLNENLNLTKKQDITESLKASNQNKNNFAMKEIKSMIENSLNYFFIYKYMYTLHRQKKRTRRSPGTKVCKGCLGLIK